MRSLVTIALLALAFFSLGVVTLAGLLLDGDLNRKGAGWVAAIAWAAATVGAASIYGVVVLLGVPQ